MKKVSILLLLLCGLFASQVLHANTDSLLAMARAANPVRYQFALDRGAQIIPTSDGRSFYLIWKPAGFDTSSRRPIVITLHGHSSWAFDEFYLWYPYCVQRGYALVALQWWFGGDDMDYYLPNQIYPIFESALRSASIKPGYCLFHGYSRGAANSYGVTVYDRNTKNNFFGATLASAGAAMPDFQVNKDISAGKFGAKPFTGTQWILYCGENDSTNAAQSGCPVMHNTAEWIDTLGGHVALFIDDPNGDHGGFHRNPTNVNAALDVFDGLLATLSAVYGADVSTDETSVTVTEDKTVLVRLASAAYTRLRLYDALGNQRATLYDGIMEAGEHRLQLPSASLTPGVYFLRLESDWFSAISCRLLISRQ